ncbi:hypothetical protein L6R53_08970 [Myxococcota bacterium]|nr:hypothetical protein [Myxococcota bacterium]
MRTAIDRSFLSRALSALSAPNAVHDRFYGGDPAGRQPAHTCYVGAQHFTADTATAWGATARQWLARYAPDATALGELLEIPAPLRGPVYDATLAKLTREPVEDLRIDFEDGYGWRPDAEEDAHALAAADHVAAARQAGALPPAVGLRIKPMTEAGKARGLRTLDLFLSRLCEGGGEGGGLPDHLLITLPKVTVPEQIAVFVAVLDHLEEQLGLPEGRLRFELMVETTEALVDPSGRCPLPSFVRAARGRLSTACIGTYDLTASAGVAAAHQGMGHPVCEHARRTMAAALSGTGVALCDGSTHVLPTGPDPADVHAAWRLSWMHVRHSLHSGFYQGWDLHPGQLPIRFAANAAFYLDALPTTLARLSTMVRASQGAVEGAIQDDAATAQALHAFTRRAVVGGWLPLQAACEQTGLLPEELAMPRYRDVLASRAEEL